jgi:hypothetical protein
MEDYISNKKHIFCGWSRKILQATVTCNTRSKIGGRRALESIEKLHLQGREEINLIATRPREIVPQAKGRSWSTSMAWGVHSSQLRFEVCIMTNVKYVLPHRHIGREEPKENEAKEEKMLHPSRPWINTRLRKPKRRLSRRINLHRSHGWCRSGAPRLQRPQRALIRSEEKKSSYRL